MIQDKKYFKKLFDLGMLKRVDLCEAFLSRGWEMQVEFSNGKKEFVETKRGEQRVFKTVEAAIKFADDLGFKKGDLNWS